MVGIDVSNHQGDIDWAKAAGEVLVSCQQYGFATGECDGETSHPVIITALDTSDGTIFAKGGFAGISFDEFDEFNPVAGVAKYYQPAEYITGYYHGQ